MDAVDTLSDKGRRGGDNNNYDYGGKESNMDNVVGVAAVLYASKEEDGGSLIVPAPEGRTTIGLKLRRTWWWMLLTHCTTRTGEEATTMMTMKGEVGARWMMSSKWQLYLPSLMTAEVESTTTSTMMAWMVIGGGTLTTIIMDEESMVQK